MNLVGGVLEASDVLLVGVRYRKDLHLIIAEPLLLLVRVLGVEAVECFGRLGEGGRIEGLACLVCLRELCHGLRLLDPERLL